MFLQQSRMDKTLHFCICFHDSSATIDHFLNVNTRRLQQLSTGSDQLYTLYNFYSITTTRTVPEHFRVSRSGNIEMWLCKKTFFSGIFSTVFLNKELILNSGI